METAREAVRQQALNPRVSDLGVITKNDLHDIVDGKKTNANPDDRKGQGKGGNGK